MLNKEWLVAPTHNYLIIQKCGNSYVRNLLCNFYNTSLRIEQTYFRPNQNITWTVIRQPYERFISGLAYDIWINNYTNYDKIFDNLELLFKHSVSSTFKNTGKVIHTLLQNSYLLGQSIDMFVDISSLTEFCLYNFKKVDKIKNETPGELKMLVKEQIITRGMEQRITDILLADTIVYEEILKSDRLWYWQNGNVLTGFNDGK